MLLYYAPVIEAAEESGDKICGQPQVHTDYNLSRPDLVISDLQNVIYKSDRYKTEAEK